MTQQSEIEHQANVAMCLYSWVYQSGVGKGGGFKFTNMRTSELIQTLGYTTSVLGRTDECVRRDAGTALSEEAWHVPSSIHLIPEAAASKDVKRSNPHKCCTIHATAKHQQSPNQGILYCTDPRAMQRNAAFVYIVQAIELSSQTQNTRICYTLGTQHGRRFLIFLVGFGLLDITGPPCISSNNYHPRNVMRFCFRTPRLLSVCSNVPLF